MEPIYFTVVQAAFAGIDLDNSTVMADQMLKAATAEEIENILPLEYSIDSTTTR